MNAYLDLFLTFAKMGAVTFGGGYAMLPILQREVVDRRGWATEPEIMDYYAIGQCTPGVIAVNVATFIGSKQKGILGSIAATLGIVFPSLVIITVIAALISGFADIPAVKYAFGGIRACVVVLIFNAVMKLFKSAVTDGWTMGIFLIVAVLMLVFNPSPVFFVLGAGIAGCVIRGIGGSRA